MIYFFIGIVVAITGVCVWMSATEQKIREWENER